MEITRSLENFTIMTVIYNQLTDFTYGDKKEYRDTRELVSSMLEIPYEEASDYVKDVINYSLNNYGKIANVYIPLLKGWTWERLPLLTKSILVMAYARKEVEKVDKSMIIDSSVSLAKKYIDPKQAKFINAILDGAL